MGRRVSSNSNETKDISRALRRAARKALWNSESKLEHRST